MHFAFVRNVPGGRIDGRGGDKTLCGGYSRRGKFLTNPGWTVAFTTLCCVVLECEDITCRHVLSLKMLKLESTYYWNALPYYSVVVYSFLFFSWFFSCFMVSSPACYATEKGKCLQNERQSRYSHAYSCVSLFSHMSAKPGWGAVPSSMTQTSFFVRSYVAALSFQYHRCANKVPRRHKNSAEQWLTICHVISGKGTV